MVLPWFVCTYLGNTVFMVPWILLYYCVFDMFHAITMVFLKNHANTTVYENSHYSINRVSYKKVPQSSKVPSTSEYYANVHFSTMVYIKIVQYYHVLHIQIILTFIVLWFLTLIQLICYDISDAVNDNFRYSTQIIDLFFLCKPKVGSKANYGGYYLREL